jgi:hypothetical protein
MSAARRGRRASAARRRAGGRRPPLTERRKSSPRIRSRAGIRSLSATERSEGSDLSGAPRSGQCKSALSLGTYVSNEAILVA